MILIPNMAYIYVLILAVILVPSLVIFYSRTTPIPVTTKRFGNFQTKSQEKVNNESILNTKETVSKNFLSLGESHKFFYCTSENCKLLEEDDEGNTNLIAVFPSNLYTDQSLYDGIYQFVLNKNKGIIYRLSLNEPYTFEQIDVPYYVYDFILNSNGDGLYVMGKNKHDPEVQLYFIQEIKRRDHATLNNIETKKLVEYDTGERILNINDHYIFTAHSNRLIIYDKTDMVSCYEYYMPENRRIDLENSDLNIENNMISVKTFSVNNVNEQRYFWDYLQMNHENLNYLGTTEYRK